MVLFRVHLPKGKLPIRCKDCHRLLTVKALAEGGCICGKRTMVTTSYLGLLERIRMKFFGVEYALVRNDELPAGVIAAQAKKM